MTSKQEDKVTMADVVLFQLTGTDPVTIAKMHGADDFIHDLGVKLGLVRGQGSIQSVDQTGNSEEKDVLKGSMVDCAMEVVNRGKAYAKGIKDPVLLKKMSFGRTALERKSNTSCANTCLGIYDLCHGLASELVVYGATPLMFTNLSTAITDFNDFSPEVRINITTKKVATDKIALYIGEIDGILENLNVLVTMLETSDPDFFETYFNNRKIIARGTRTQCLRVFVCDAAGNGLGKVSVTINSGSDVFVKKTTAKGNFIVKNMITGIYRGTCRKAGFKDVTTEFAVTVGERTVIRIAMEADIAVRFISQTA